MLTEEQIKDIQEVRDGLLIPLVQPVPTRPRCQCSHCQQLDNSAHVIPTLAGKISTKIRR